jgi:archaemetzincin
LEKIKNVLRYWTGFLIFFGSLGLAAMSDPNKIEVEIIPLGKIDPAVLMNLKTNLADILSAAVLIRKEAENLPDEAYDPARRQYLSLPILLRLAENKRGGGQRILGVMDEDVYTPGLNFIFGQADSAASVSLISLKRLRQDFYGLPPNENLFLERALKEAVHELGHLLNLGHCPDPSCVMHFSNSLADTDRKGHSFCSICQKRLK